MDFTTVHDQGVCRFEVVEPNDIAYLQYQESNGVLDIISIQVPPALEGNGIASHLVKEAIKYSIDKGLLIKTTCPFAKSYFIKHPELSHLLYVK